MEASVHPGTASGLERRGRRFVLLDLLAITLLWAATVPLVNPVGNFPLLDDWVFGAVVKHLLESGTYHPLGNEFMTLVTDVFWGAAFCLPKGFSFTALRFSTVVASALGIAGVYLLTAEVSIRRGGGLLIAFLVGFSPIYYTLSHTFMTDVPFVAVSVWAILFFVRYLKHGATLFLFLGTLLSVLATLSRELGLCIGAAFLVTYLIRNGVTLRAVLKGAIPFLICVGVFVGFSHWSSESGRTESLDMLMVYLVEELWNPVKPLQFIFSNLYLTLVNLGVFLIPILLWSVADLFRSSPRRIMIGLTGGIVLLCACIVVRANLGKDLVLPFYDNVVVPSGVGPTMLRDVFLLHLDNMRPLPDPFWQMVTGVGFLGAACLLAVMHAGLTSLWARIKSKKSFGPTELASVFLSLCTLIYFVPILPSAFYFDRYVLMAIPLVAVVISAYSPTIRNPKRGDSDPVLLSAFAIIVMFAVFSILATRDYLMWNRVRWRALTELMRNDHVAPEYIDGGYEFNGTYTFSMKEKFDEKYSWWWVKGDRYQLGFGAIPGYTVIRKYSYYHLMPPHIQDVVVLRKDQ